MAFRRNSASSRAVFQKRVRCGCRSTATAAGVTANQSFTWTVGALVVTLGNPGAQANYDGDAVNLQLNATASPTRTITYAETGLPAGLNLNSSTGLISGTVTNTADVQSPYSVTLTAIAAGVSAVQTLTWSVGSTTLTLTNPGEQTNYDSDVVSLQLNATSTAPRPISYSATGLPPGLAVNSGTGLISGTLTTTADVNGPYYVTVTAAAAGVTTSQTFAWLANPIALTLDNPSDQYSFDGDSVNLQLSATCQPGRPMSYAASGLPQGLAVNASTGLISGSISIGADAQSPYTVQISISAAGITAVQTFAWNVGAPAATLVNPGTLADVVGDTVDVPVSATDSASHALSYAATGLPPELTINSATGVISGTVAAGADDGSPYSVTVTAADVPDSAVTASVSFQWTITGGAGIAVTLAAPGNQVNNQQDPVDITLCADDSAGNALNYSAVNLPPGLTINPATGVISGTVQAGAAFGIYSLTVTAADATNPDAAATQAFQWTVHPEVTPSNPGSQGNLDGDIVAVDASAFDSAGDAVSYSASGLPPGLSIDPTSGLISGTVAAGDELNSPYTVTVTAMDTIDSSATASESFHWTAGSGVSVNGPGAQANADGDSVYFVVSAAGTAGQTLTYAASGLPPGLTINSSTGVISGTVAGGADANSPYAVVVSATDTATGGSQGVGFQWAVSASGTVTVSLTNPAAQTNSENDNVGLTLLASDSSGHALRFTASNLPPGLGINANTGLISGTVTPGSSYASPYQVTVAAYDALNGSIGASQTFEWSVQRIWTTAVGSHLSELYDEYVSWQNSGSGPFQPSDSTLEVAGGAVAVEATAASAAAFSNVQAELTNLGGQITATLSPDIAAMVPISQLPAVGGLSDVVLLTPIFAPIQSSAPGPVGTQGDAVMLTSEYRQYSGDSGSGQTVGVLSDSFSQASGAATNYVQDQQSGALPGPNNTITGQQTPVDVIQPDPSGYTDEGRAMLQVVHAVAPGAGLAFASDVVGGQLGFASNILKLAAPVSAGGAGATVIVDDGTYMNEPMFEDGVIAQAVNSVTGMGVAYLSAAGNNGNNSYDADYTPYTSTPFPSGAIPSATGAPVFLGGVPQKFADGTDYQSITINNNASVKIGFQWVAPGGYASIPGNQGTQSVMDIYLEDMTTHQIVAADTSAHLNGDPAEVLNFTNTTGSARNYGLLLVWNKSLSSVQPLHLKYIDFLNGAGGVTVTSNNTQSGTVFGHGNAVDMSAVGAADWYNNNAAVGATNLPVLEPYSSTGSTPVYFNTNGAFLNTNDTPDVRLHPDLVAPDGVETTFYNSGPKTGTGADGDSEFFGTSCAAANAAGMAALLLQAYPTDMPAQIYSIMQDAAINMDNAQQVENPTPNAYVGFGFAQAPATDAGNWQEVTSVPGGNASGIGTMLLLPNGTIMAQTSGSSDVSNTWALLTPDTSGKYVSGTWSSLSAMHLPRQYYGSVVLPSGDVMVYGGEYTVPSKPGETTFANAGEIFDPSGGTPTANGANTGAWKVIPSIPGRLFPAAAGNVHQFGDDPLEVLSNGHVLAGYLGYVTQPTTNPNSPPPYPQGNETFVYDPSNRAWSSGPTKLRSDPTDEESWVKLPGPAGDILHYELWASLRNSGDTPGYAQYLDSGEWKATAKLSAPLSEPNETELGPALLMPDGVVLQLGANGHFPTSTSLGTASNTALFNPSGAQITIGGLAIPAKSWVTGPTIPQDMIPDDAPAAVLPDGNIIFAADSTTLADEQALSPSAPTELFEYNANTDQINQLTLPALLTTELASEAGTDLRMLVLPNGQVALSDDNFNDLWFYSESQNVSPSCQPTVTNVTNGTSGFVLTGTQLNGMSEGAEFGDDAQMASNYPIVTLTDATGAVSFARTFDWSSTGVQTGTAPVTAEFDVNGPAGPYVLSVSASGISSNNVLFVDLGPGADNVTVKLDSTGQYAQVFQNPGSGATLLGQFPLSWFSSVDIAGAGSATLDYSNGAFQIPVSVSASSLSVNLHSGVQATLQDDGTAANGISERTGSSFSPITFADPSSSLTITANGGNSVIQLAAMAKGFAPITETFGGAASDTFQCVANNVFPSTTDVVLQSATLDLNGHNQLVSVSSDTSSTNVGGTITNSAAQTATLTVSIPQYERDYFAGVESGNLALTKIGQGSLILAPLSDSSDSYTGITTITQGVLIVGAQNAIPSASQVVDVSLLDLFGNNEDIGILTSDSDGDGLVFSSRGLATLTLSPAASTVFSGTITTAVALTLDASGANASAVQETLSGNNNYPGPTTITAGILADGIDNAISGSALDVNANATLDLNGHNQQLYLIEGSGTITNSGSKIKTLTVNFLDGNSAFAGSLTGKLGLTLTGGGMLSLAGASTYSGATDITGGNIPSTLQAGATNAFSENSDLTDNGGLDLGGYSAIIGALTGNGMVGSSVSGPVTLTVGNTNDDGTFSGVIQNVKGTVSFAKTGSGSETLAGPPDNTYGGSTTVNKGTLKAVANANELPIDTNVTVASGAILDLAGFAEQIGVLNGGGTVENNGTSAVTLTIGANQTGTFSGVIENGAKVSIYKQGTGTQIFSGANTYTGDTTIAGGTLEIDGSVTSSVYVWYDGTLQGTGSTSGNVSNGGIVIPGSTLTGSFVPGKLSVGGTYADENSSAILEIYMAGTAQSPQYGELSVSGTATFLCTLDVSFLGGFAPAYPDKFTIITFKTGSTVDFASDSDIPGVFGKPVTSSTSVTLNAQP